MYVPIDFIIFIVSYIIQMCYKINGKKSLQHRHRTAQHIEQHSTAQRNTRHLKPAEACYPM
jgi:hypothetical protein